MFAQGAASRRRANPGKRWRNGSEPRRGDRNLRDSFSRPDLSQGLLALLAAPWADICRRSAAEDKTAPPMWFRVFGLNDTEPPPAELAAHLHALGLAVEPHFKGDDLGWTSG